MGIAVKAPRGGLVEHLVGSSYPLILRNAEIERFEDHHRGIFDVWDGFFGRSTKPTSREVRDIVALGLVGGGMADVAADALMEDLGPDQNLFLYRIAQALLGVAFMPDSVEGGGNDQAPTPEDDPEKKTDPALGA
jgi:hypothetical protein